MGQRSGGRRARYSWLLLAAASLQGSDTSAAEQAIATARSASASAFVQANVPQSQWNDATLAEVAQATAAIAYETRVDASSAPQSAYQSNIVGGAHAWLTQANFWSQVAQVEASATEKGRQLAQLTPQLIFDTALQTAFDEYDSTNMAEDLAWTAAVLDAQKNARITTAALDLAFADKFASLDQAYSDAIADAEWTQDQADLLSQRVLMLAEALRASLTESIAATADWTQATDGAGADTAQSLAFATAESDWLDRVWTDWKARQDNQAALDVPDTTQSPATPSASEAILEAWRQLVTDLANADKAYATSLNTSFYRLEDQAYDRANADENAAKTKETVRFLQRIAELQQQISNIPSLTKSQLDLVSLENPTGTPPKPGRPPRTGDITKDLLNDLAYFSRIGQPVRAGDVAIYEDDKGNLRSGIAAMTTALQVIKEGIDRLVDIAALTTGGWGMAFAAAYRLPATINAVAEGDPAAIRSALTGLLVRLPGAGLISTVFRAQGLVMAAENLRQASADYDQSGDRMLAGLRLTGAAVDFYHGAKGAVQGAIATVRSIGNAANQLRAWAQARNEKVKAESAPKKTKNKPKKEEEQTDAGVPQRGRTLEEQWRGMGKEDKPKVNDDRSKRANDKKPTQAQNTPITNTPSPDRIPSCLDKNNEPIRDDKGNPIGCFAAGTPLQGEWGAKNVEHFRKGDLIWSRSEFDPDGPCQLKEVEEVFVRTGRIYHLHVDGQIIRTTDEHPFFVINRGWTKAVELQPGDLLRTFAAEDAVVEEVHDTGDYETVYNLRVADWHTYFVGISLPPPEALVAV